ncbi:MAG: DEAD/DEAH box helicase [Spirulina sp. SIO3F2]|nr:DEAD/DEAH box helicase [Spirulina sp. SIO3F2]
MASTASARQSTLQRRYEKLTPVQRSLVQVFALFYEPVSRINAFTCWNDAILPLQLESSAKPLNTSQFSAQITALIKFDILVQNRNEGPHCPELLIDIVTRDAVNMGTFEPIVQAVKAQSSTKKRFGSPYFYQEREWLRALRIAIYREDQAEIDTLQQVLENVYWKPKQTVNQRLQHIFNNPFDPEWVKQLSPEFRALGLQLILADAACYCRPADAVFEVVEELYHNGQANPALCVHYVEQLWLRGHLREASGVLSETKHHPPSSQRSALLGAIAFLMGQTDDAIAHYQTGIKQAGKSKAAQAEWFTSPAAALYFFALLKANSPTALKDAQKYSCLILERQDAHWLDDSLLPLLTVVQNQQGRFNSDAVERFSDYTLSTVGVATLLEVYSLYWLNAKDLNYWLLPHLVQQYQAAAKANYGWIGLELAELMARLEPDEVYSELAAGLREGAGSEPLIEVIQHREPWELSLNALTNLTNSATDNAEGSPSGYRLIWRVQFRSLDDWQLIPVEQKLSVKGGWTKGKAIALKRLHYPGDYPDYLTAQDERIADALQVEYEYRGYYGANKPTYSFNEAALPALVGHPLVFWADTPTVRVDVVTGEPELLIKRQSDNRLRIELSPAIPEEAKMLAFKETPTRLKVVRINDDHHRIRQLLGEKNRLDVPAHAEARVLEAISSVSELVTIQSDIGGGVAAEEVPADSTPRMHLLPAGEGLKVSILAHPFPEGGSYYRPGEGGATVIAEVGGKRLQTQRDLKLEKKQAKAVKTTCSVLQTYKAKKGEWLIEEPEDCLELLVQLQALGDRVKIEWPEGEKFRVSRQLGLGDFKFNILQQQDWFAASGEVRISDDQVVDLQQIMALLDSTPGSFVELSNGEFLALTHEFRKRLDTLKRLSDRQGKNLRIHGLAALALDDMMEDVAQLEVDRAWKQHLKKIKAAQTIDPQVPETLEATLRDYQLAGFTWLSRLAHWGVGACLADDMGLGKTLQAIAVILTRCVAGPTLVIAPTSVGLNWVSEVERFAPSLQVKVFGSGDRQQMLNGLEPRDLVVCSYGLLQQTEVAQMLTQVSWEMIVLDEAQAIKNYETKRSQAAMALQGNFKLITTGTPIENHLGELWNLFRFINPGLLGSLESFNQRFAYAIERDQNEAAREALRRLIQPFILRRTKNQVLKELPSRTEITLQVELSAEEMAFYEALRRDAIEKLSESDAPAGHKHLQVLAEIMRLRRACCNPKLVRPELGLPSAKLQQFGEVLTELLENDHKALVFSQFVDHLTILREYLDQHKITYQYLDGSTPAKKRKERVDAFQDGEGDVFLISLKAGGTGLNLTAADFVIHMDSWWNPAVEDQASDRAHRIGQQRPVTIYRLVAQGTIEDKIVALHQTKRDLADSLLDGSDVSGKISTAELLSLIQQ